MSFWTPHCPPSTRALRPAGGTVPRAQWESSRDETQQAEAVSLRGGQHRAGGSQRGAHRAPAVEPNPVGPSTAQFFKPGHRFAGWPGFSFAGTAREGGHPAYSSQLVHGRGHPRRGAAGGGQAQRRAWTSGTHREHWPRASSSSKSVTWEPAKTDTLEAARVAPADAATSAPWSSSRGLWDGGGSGECATSSCCCRP